MHRKEKDMRTISWDSFTFRGRARKNSANNTKNKSSEMEDRNQESVTSQKPRRECSPESNAIESLNYAET